MDLLGKLQSWWRGVRMQCADRAHKYFKCPCCGQRLRVPRGAGQIQVTCRACGVSFGQNS